MKLFLWDFYLKFYLKPPLQEQNSSYLFETLYTLNKATKTKKLRNSTYSINLQCFNSDWMKMKQIHVKLHY